MKKSILPLLAAASLLFTACERDPFPLELTQFDTYWDDRDLSGTRTADDGLSFDFQITTTAPDNADQIIVQWELSCSLNGGASRVFFGDDNALSNGVNAQFDLLLRNLDLPGIDDLQAGDVLEFELWAVDDRGTELRQFYTFQLEP